MQNRSSFAVVFDFDGTLIDSKEIKLNSYLQAGVHFYLIKNDEDFSALPRFLAGSSFNP